MKCTFSIMAVLLLCSSSVFAQYTNLLDGGTTQTVDSAWATNTITVGETIPGNALYIVSGGVVTSTNGYVGTNAGASNNLVSVTGTGSWTIEDTLEIGIGTSNVVSVGGGGTIAVGDLILNPGNTFNLDSGGTFAITTNFNASTDGFNWNDDGKLSVGGVLTGMAVTDAAVRLDGGRDLTIDGGTWDISGTNLVVGYDGSGSTLVIQNSGTLSSATTYIGNTNIANNQVRVEGTNSLWDIGGNLIIGNGSNSVNNALSVSGAAEVRIDGELTLNTGNSLSLASGGSIEVGSTMNVYSNSTISGDGTIGFGANAAKLAFYGDINLAAGVVFSANAGFVNTLSFNNGELDVSGFDPAQYENFGNLELVDSDLTGIGNLNTFNSIDMTGGTIDPAGDDTGLLEIGGLFTATGGTVYSAQVYETRWDELVFTGTNDVDLSNMKADVLVVSAPLGAVTIMSNSVGNLTGSFSQIDLEDRLLLYNAVLQVSSNEVTVSLEADPLESVMEFAAMEMVRAGFGGMQNAVFTRTKQLRRNLVATAHTIAYEETPLLIDTNAPAGAMGPGDQNTIFDMHVWLQQYSGQGDYDRRNNADGYTLNNNGTSIGADRLIGEALILGVNYTYARSSADTTGNDDLDSETYWIGAYGEWIGEDGLYVDALASYGFTDYDTTRREVDYVGKASYDGQAFGASLDVGQYYHSGNLALAPYAGLRVLTINADGHKEDDELGSSVHVDEVDHDVVESAIGLKMRHRFDTRVGRFQTTGYAEWTHDFVDDDVSATLTAVGFPSVSTESLSPDTDTVNVGLGYSWTCREYMEIGIGYAGRFSENYEEHTGALMLDIMF